MVGCKYCLRFSHYFRDLILEILPGLLCGIFVLPCNHLVLGEHLALPHPCACHHCHFLDACCDAAVSKVWFETCWGRWSRPWCLSLDPTASRIPQPCTQTSGKWSSWLPSSHKGVVSLSAWLHCWSWCTTSLAALGHHCLCYTGEVPFLLLVRQDTWCTPFAFPCVAQWSVLDGPCSVLLQGLRLHIHLDWPVLSLPKVGPRWQCSTSPLVWCKWGTHIVPPWKNGWTSVWWRLHQVDSQGCQLIGELLYTVQVHGRPYKFEGLTVIDTVTNLVGLVRIEENLDHITQKFAQCWLTCCPWLQYCIHDSGGEFTGPEFQTLLQKCHIRDVCTTATNPQSNAVCKRMHQMIGIVLRTLLHGESPQDMANAKEYIDEALSIAMHAMRAAIHSTLVSSPESLTFNRDMFLNIPLIADWHTITQRQEHLINENLIRENQKSHK